ncbi:MAG TPA: serine hydrolase domain-containing protein [Kofleriaceae bacterium]|jgi:CubicO group peptidase (beta-lactamase class C family)|nr:serine hydrolase domain-containing protein [Kofleriaceae bacterium]
MRSVAPESVGLASEGLRRVDHHLQSRYIDSGKLAGALTLVARRGEIAWLSPLGLADRERKTPMRPDTIFRIYSMTKPITSVALMMLHERGVFSLSDPVHRFIPAWEHLRVYRYGRYPHFVTEPAARPMTVRDLLTHTSGLSYHIADRTPVDEAYRQLGVGTGGGTLREMVDKLATLPLEFSPGTRWGYSAATDILGHLIEVMSGERLDDYLRTHIFDPLGMVDTGFTVPADKLARFAANYVRLPGATEATLMDDPMASTFAQPKPYLSGGGGLVSTATDYARFAEMLRRGGELDGVRILGPRTIAYMATNHLPDGQELTTLATPGSFSETRFDGMGFGLGFAVVIDPVRAQVPTSAGEYSWGGMASTAFWINPAEQLVVVLLTQLVPSSTYDLRGQLKSIVYGAIID